MIADPSFCVCYTSMHISFRCLVIGAIYREGLSAMRSRFPMCVRIRSWVGWQYRISVAFYCFTSCMVAFICMYSSPQSLLWFRPGSAKTFTTYYWLSLVCAWAMSLTLSNHKYPPIPSRQIERNTVWAACYFVCYSASLVGLVFSVSLVRPSMGTC